MAAAWIGFAGGVIAVVISAVVAVRQSRADEQLAKLQSELDTERHRREALIDRELRAADVLSLYREPLAAAAFELQSRLYNILRYDFFETFGGSHPRNEIALRTTLFRLAQYLGWTEILRRDIQYLSFPEAEHTRRVVDLQRQIAGALLSDEYGEPMMIWTDEQRALGELMIVEQFDKVMSMGYAEFDSHCRDVFEPWLARVRAEVREEAGRDRLRTLQRLLCELVETLDVNRVRYERDLRRA